MNIANLPCIAEPSIASTEHKKQKGTMPQLSWLVVFQPSPSRTKLNPRPAHVEFVVDKVALGEVIL
jgi:hypothetical protein